MKNLLSTVAAVAIAFSASAAFADGQTLLIEQLGSGQYVETTQTGLFNYSHLLQNGNSEIAHTSQIGQNNQMNGAQGKQNPAGDNSAPQAYENTSGGQTLVSVQNGDSNSFVFSEVGVSNELRVQQTGNSNSINAAINDNLSKTQIIQTGYLNAATTHQGI